MYLIISRSICSCNHIFSPSLRYTTVLFSFPRYFIPTGVSHWTFQNSTLFFPPEPAAPPDFPTSENGNCTVFRPNQSCLKFLNCFTAHIQPMEKPYCFYLQSAMNLKSGHLLLLLLSLELMPSSPLLRWLLQPVNRLPASNWFLAFARSPRICSYRTSQRSFKTERSSPSSAHTLPAPLRGEAGGHTWPLWSVPPSPPPSFWPHLLPLPFPF